MSIDTLGASFVSSFGVTSATSVNATAVPAVVSTEKAEDTVLKKSHRIKIDLLKKVEKAFTAELSEIKTTCEKCILESQSAGQINRDFEKTQRNTTENLSIRNPLFFEMANLMPQRDDQSVKMAAIAKRRLSQYKLIENCFHTHFGSDWFFEKEENNLMNTIYNVKSLKPDGTTEGVTIRFSLLEEKSSYNVDYLSIIASEQKIRNFESLLLPNLPVEEDEFRVYEFNHFRTYDFNKYDVSIWKEKNRCIDMRGTSRAEKREIWLPYHTNAVLLALLLGKDSFSRQI